MLSNSWFKKFEFDCKLPHSHCSSVTAFSCVFSPHYMIKDVVGKICVWDSYGCIKNMLNSTLTTSPHEVKKCWHNIPTGFLEIIKAKTREWKQYVRQIDWTKRTRDYFLEIISRVQTITAHLTKILLFSSVIFRTFLLLTKSFTEYFCFLFYNILNQKHMNEVYAITYGSH